MNKPLVPGSFAAWGRTFSQKLIFLEQATCPGQLRCLGQNLFSKYDLFLTNHVSRAASPPGAELFPGNLLFLKKPLVPGSFAAWGRTFSSKSTFVLKKPRVRGSSAAWGRVFSINFIFFEEATCPGQLRCPGQNFFSKKRAFKNSGIPVRRTKRRKSNKNGRSGILGLLCAEQDARNLKIDFQEFWDSCAQNKTSEISKNSF